MKPALHRLAVLLVALATVLAGVLVSSPPAAAVEPGGITGLVLSHEGEPVPFTRVNLFMNFSDDLEDPAQWVFHQQEYTDAAGRYLFTDLPPTHFWVCFKGDTPADYLGECWNNSVDSGRPEVVNVGTSVVSGIDEKFNLASHITGQVTNDAGDALAGIRVKAWSFFRNSVDGDWWHDVTYATTDEFGRYDIGGLGPRTYRLEFYDPSKAHHSEWWGGGSEVEEATDIEVGVRLDGADSPHPWSRNFIDVTLTAVPGPPTNLTAPSISGPAMVGERLTVDRGEWSPSAVTFEYRWMVDGVAVPRHSEPTLVVPSSALGRRVSVMVTGYSMLEYDFDAATSAATAVIRPGRLGLARAPRLDGTPRVGRILRAAVAPTRPGATTVRYAWLRDQRVIPGATTTAYRLVAADRGRRIAVRVTYGRSAYQPLTVVSRPSVLVRRP